MALAPNIPTSFVPKQPVKTAPHRARSGVNTFLLVALIVLAAACLGAGATFGYELYLKRSLDAKAARLAAAEDRIDEATVQDFIQSRNRFTIAETLLNEHVAVSQFFEVLESLTLQNVRFSTLTLSLAEDRSALLAMTGIARNFNALAAQSNAFASENRLKRVIFSDIDPEDNGTVSFSLSADVDAGLLLMEMPASAPEIPAPILEEPVEEQSAAPGASDAAPSGTVEPSEETPPAPSI